MHASPEMPFSAFWPFAHRSSLRSSRPSVGAPCPPRWPQRGALATHCASTARLLRMTEEAARMGAQQKSQLLPAGRSTRSAFAADGCLWDAWPPHDVRRSSICSRAKKRIPARRMLRAPRTFLHNQEQRLSHLRVTISLCMLRFQNRPRRLDVRRA